METIKALYYSRQEDVPQLPELSQQKKQIDEICKGAGLTGDTLENISYEVNGVVMYAELQGFIGGFQYAMQIASDCRIGGATKC